MSVYGRIVHGGMVEAAARETIKEWIAVYLAEMERQTGRKPKSVALPRSYHTAPEFDYWPEDQLPAIILVSTGTADKPHKEGNGEIRVPFALGVGVVVAARDQASAGDLAKLYGAAIRALMVQRPSLGGFALGVDWMDETWDDVPAKKRRTQAAALLAFRVEVDEVVSTSGGPVDVPADPYQPPAARPTVVSVDVDIEEAA